jgi:hypothetical protein
MLCKENKFVNSQQRNILSTCKQKRLYINANKFESITTKMVNALTVQLTRQTLVS